MLDFLMILLDQVSERQCIRFCPRRLLNRLIGTPGTIEISSYCFFRLDRRCSVRSVDSRSQPQRGRESARFFSGDTRRDNEESRFVVQSRRGHWDSYWDVRQEKNIAIYLSHTWKKAGRQIRDAHRRRTQESRINPLFLDEMFVAIAQSFLAFRIAPSIQ